MKMLNTEEISEGGDGFTILLGKLTTYYKPHVMKKLLTELEWIFDFYFAFMLYNGMKFHRYNRYMLEKWGKRYRKTRSPFIEDDDDPRIY